MAAIDQAQFAGECIAQGDAFGAWAHYMVAVAQLRSGIDDKKQGNLIGPFMIDQIKWNENREDPDLRLEESDLNSWDMQCMFFAWWTHKVHQKFVTQNNKSPNSEELYLAQFPGESVAALGQAITDTAKLMPGGKKIAASDTSLAPKDPAGG